MPHAVPSTVVPPDRPIVRCGPDRRQHHRSDFVLPLPCNAVVDGSEISIALCTLHTYLWSWCSSQWCDGGPFDGKRQRVYVAMLTMARFLFDFLKK
jgi:hypothetical protein